MKRLILVGSPRAEGKSAALADIIFETNIEEHPEDELFLVPISEIEVDPCIGCDACKQESPVIVKSEDGEEITLMKHRCVFDDDMQTVYDLIDDADEIVVVCPVYFSGAPAPFKCLLDRLQPYFWTNARHEDKRLAVLHIVGEGHDPFGHAALISEVQSALYTAGFSLERVLDWSGKISDSGEITEEAVEEEPLVIQSGARVYETAKVSEKQGSGAKSPASKKPRPKLNLKKAKRNG